MFNSDILYVNSQSLPSHFDEICNSILCYNPKIVLLSETRTTGDINDAEIAINNYNCVRWDSSGRRMGGVVIYIHHDLEFSQFRSFVLEDNFWCKFVKIKIAGTKWTVGCLYHSPSASRSVFLEEFDGICDAVFSGGERGILVGDFNLDAYSDSYYVNKLKNIFLMYGMKQCVSEATRVTDTSSTLIDYVLTNSEYVETRVHPVPRITDHYIISVSICHSTLKLNNLVKKVRIMNEYNLDMIASQLRMCKWSLNSVDVDNLYLEFIKNCEEVVNAVAPIITFNIKNGLPWFDSDVKNKIRERDIAYKAFRSSNQQNRVLSWQLYKSKRNEVVGLLREKKRRYYHKKLIVLRITPV